MAGCFRVVWLAITLGAGRRTGGKRVRVDFEADGIVRRRNSARGHNSAVVGALSMNIALGFYHQAKIIFERTADNFEFTGDTAVGAELKIDIVGYAAGD